MELEEAGSSEQSMQQSQKKETGSDTQPSDGVCTDDYKELIVQMRKSNLLFQQMSSVPLGELTMLLAISRQSERLGAVRGLRTRNCHEAVPAGRFPDASRPGEKGIHSNEERRGRPALCLCLSH